MAVVHTLMIQNDAVTSGTLLSPSRSDVGRVVLLRSGRGAGVSETCSSGRASIVDQMLLPVEERNRRPDQIDPADVGQGQQRRTADHSARRRMAVGVGGERRPG